ncbi:MAG TPA: FtsX-like permease family protein [Thermoanaerobaculia bacterium]|nr:FtsX-like permease family protein [Thermoanaerobaculia bacterium]
MRQTGPKATDEARIPAADFVDLRREARIFQGVAALRTGFSQSPRRSMVFALRAAAAPAGLAADLRRIVRAADPSVAAQEGVKTMAGEVADALAPLRILGILMLIFGAVALVLAAVGVYGILAQSVAQRTAEFGLRMALGGRRQDVLRLVLGQAWKLSAAGVALGLPIAFVLARVMASFLFGVIAFNAAIFAGLALLMTAVALLAAYIPARRALGVDPALALRSQ